MSSNNSVNLHTAFNQIFEMVGRSFPSINNVYSSNSLNNFIGDIIPTFPESTTGDYVITPYLQPQPQIIPWLWVDVVKDYKCDDLKKSVPKYPVSNFSIDKDGTSRIEIAVTGFDKDDISIEREDFKLIVKGVKSEKDNAERKQYLYKEIACRDFELKYDLSEKMDLDNIDISLNKGVLTIKIKLLEEHQPIRKSYMINK